MKLLKKEGSKSSRANKSKAPVRMGAALSIALAGTLVAGLCGGSFTTALAADGAAKASAQTAASAGGATVNATPKDEVVYARMSASGKVNDVYVVNVLSPKTPGKVTDYGKYESVQNLTDSSEVLLNGDAVTAEVAGDSLSYQGDMGARALPWDVSISYELDGKRIEPADLGGKSGKLAVSITTKRNASVDAAFFDNYLLQITVPFVSSKTTNIATEDGQIALAGSNTQVTFTGLPGKDGAFKATAQVSDFSLSGISFAAVPFSMGIEAPDTSGLVSGFRQLGDGVGQLEAGAKGLASGASDLASGAGQTADGVGGIAGGTGSLAGGASDLANGAGQVASGVQGVADGASGLSAGLAAYQGGLSAQATEARGKVTDIGELQKSYNSAAQTYLVDFAKAYNNALKETSDEAIAMQQAANATMDQKGALLAALGELMDAVGGNAGLLGAAGALDGAAAGLGSASDPQSLLGGAGALYAGASALTAGAQGIASGASELSGGADALANGAEQAASGAGQLATGANQLSSGAGQLAVGTSALYTEVQAIPDKVQKEIDAMMAEYDKSDFKPVSFASSKNTDVKLVQFVITTDPIQVPKSDEVPEPQPEQTIWDRVLALFGISS